MTENEGRNDGEVLEKERETETKTKDGKRLFISPKRGRKRRGRESKKDLKTRLSAS